MKSVMYWYQFFTRCQGLEPILHGVKFAKYEIEGSTNRACVGILGCAVCAIYASCAGTAAHRHNNRIIIKKSVGIQFGLGALILA